MNIGETYTLSAMVTPSNAANQSISWSSSDKDVATVDQSGKVTAVKAGSATITVRTTDGGHTATCSVTVKNSDNPPTSGNSLVGTTWCGSFSDNGMYVKSYFDLTLTFDSQSTFIMEEEVTAVDIEGGTYHDSYTEYGTYKVDGSSLVLSGDGWIEPLPGTISGNIITLYGDSDIVVVLQKQ